MRNGSKRLNFIQKGTGSHRQFQDTNGAGGDFGLAVMDMLMSSVSRKGLSAHTCQVGGRLFSLEEVGKQDLIMHLSPK